MKISAKQYAKALFSEIYGKSEEESLFVISKFIEILKNDNSLSQIEKIITHFSGLWKKESLLVEAEISTSRKIDENIKASLVEYLKKASRAEKIQISEEIDEEIIGGFIIRYEDKIIDASIKDKIKTFKNKLIQ